jgi:hypothetical protein
VCALNFFWQNYAFPIGVNFENRRAHYSAQNPGHEEVRDRSSTRAAPYLQSDVHRLRAYPGVFDLVEKCNAARGLSSVGDGVRRADDLDLWW